MNLIRVGMWIWGGVTVIFVLCVLIIIIRAGLWLTFENKFDTNTPHSVYGMYFAIKDQGGIVGGILGFSGLAWTHFFVMRHREETSKSQEGKSPIQSP